MSPFSDFWYILHTYLLWRKGEWSFTWLDWRWRILTGNTGRHLWWRLLCARNVRWCFWTSVFWNTLEAVKIVETDISFGDNNLVNNDSWRQSHPVWCVNRRHSIQVCHGKLQPTSPQVIVNKHHPHQWGGTTKRISTWLCVHISKI